MPQIQDTYENEIFNKDEIAFELPSFIREYSFYQSNIFKRYISKCKIKLMEFMDNYIGQIRGIEELNKILIGSLFRINRLSDNLENHCFLGQLLFQSEYFNEEYKFYKEILDYSYKNMDDTKSILTKFDNPISSILDIKAADYFEKIILNMFKDSDLDIECNFNEIMNGAIEYACKQFLETKSVFKHLNKEQINTQALPETNEEIHSFYILVMTTFSFNLHIMFNSIANNNILEKKIKEKRENLKNKEQLLRKDIKEKEKIINKLELEAKKKNDVELKDLVHIPVESKINNLETEITLLKRQLQKANKDIDNYKQINLKLTEEIDNLNNKTLSSDLFTNNKTITCDYTKKYGFVCQHEVLNTKLKETFPNCIIIDKPLSKKDINIDVMVSITKEISHSLYNQTKQVAVNSNIPYVHCSDINMDKIAECIAVTLS